MNEASLGAKLEPSPTNQAVLPFTGTPACVDPAKGRATPRLNVDAEMGFIPGAQFGRVFGLDEDPANSRYALHSCFSVLSIGSEARFTGFCESLFSGFFSEVFAPADSLLLSGAFAPEAGSRSWAWIQQMGRVTTVKAVNTAFVLIYMRRSVMVMG
jgi:hypothetical protein